MRRFLFWSGCLIAVAVLSYAYVNAKTEQTADKKPVAAPPAVPVTAATAQKADTPVIVRGLGTVTAFATVALKSRVVGAITQLNFREGQMVRTGDLLIQLDPRPYEATLEQAQANRVKDQAALANAKVDLDRYADLLKRNFAPEQQVATQKTTVAQAEAAIAADEAAIKAAQLNVDYAALRSPIDGVTGIRQVDLGNIIQANSQTLVTITQIKPIYVIYTLPEADIARVRSALAAKTVAVQAFAADDKTKLAEGVLNLVDNAVDQGTGTVKLKAQFENADTALWPGQFVNIHTVLNVVHDGVTIPAAAVQNGPKGAYTYVIDTDSKVENRPLTIVQTEANQALVGGGLAAGEKVVTAGQYRLQRGTKVRIADQIANAEQKLSDAPAGTDAAQ
ncbi:MAG: efflux RND transporter periplasmic adaptor subunit [Beijerinckiaceae bacterium]|nr:efflux RND transporter periplasmic adaptor subunit [Beijerinckiaceae bacterium]